MQDIRDRNRVLYANSVHPAEAHDEEPREEGETAPERGIPSMIERRARRNSNNALPFAPRRPQPKRRDPPPDSGNIDIDIVEEE